MNWIVWFVKSLFCRHQYEWFSNIYGEEIIACGYKRSKWVCTKCQKLQLRKKLLSGYESV